MKEGEIKACRECAEVAWLVLWGKNLRVESSWEVGHESL